MSLVVRINGDLTGFNKAMNDFNRKVRDASKDLDRVGKEFQNIGANLTRRVTAPIVAIGTASVAAAATFEYSMSKVATTTGATGEELERLEATSRDWGRNSIFNANEVAEAMAQMGLAGFDAVQIYEALPGAIALAQSANMDLAEATGRVTSVLNIFNKEAEDATLVADMMTSANKTVDASINDTEQTLQNAASAVNRYGISLEDATTMTALMADMNLTGARAGTAMRAMFDDLASACRNNNQAMQDLGIAFHDAEGNARPAMDVINDLRYALSDMSPEARDAALELMGISDTGMAALIPMLEASGDRVDYLTDRFGDVSGAAQHYADIMGDNLKSELRIFWNNIRDIGIEIGNVMLPVIREITRRITDFARSFAENLTPEMARTIVIVGSLIASVGPLLYIVGKMISAFATVKAKMQVMRSGFGGLTKAKVLAGAKFIAIVAAIALFVAGLIHAYNNSERFRERVNRIFEAIRRIVVVVFEAVGNFVRDVISGIREFWDEHGEAIAQAFFNVFDFIMGVVEFAMPFIKRTIENVWDAIKGIIEAGIRIFKGIIEFLTGIFTGDWEMVWNGIKEIFGGVLDTIGAIFTFLWEQMKVVLEWFWEIMKGIFSLVAGWFYDNVVEPVKNFFTGLWEGIRDGAANAWDAVVDVWNTVAQWFDDTIIQPVRDFFTGMWDGVKEGGANAWNAVMDVFKAVPEWFRDRFRTAWENVRNVFSTGGKIFSGIKEGIADVFKTVVNGIIGGINTVIAVPFNIINGALDTIRNISIVGARPFSGLPTINVPQIPFLRRGGVLERGQVGFLEGDGAEAVVPLEKNRQWIGRVTDEFAKQLNLDALLASLKASKVDQSKAMSAMVARSLQQVNASIMKMQRASKVAQVNQMQANQNMMMAAHAPPGMSVNYRGLLEGANIHWHNKEDIRRTMQEIEWQTNRDDAWR